MGRQRLLVVGGTGFIGTALVERAVALGYDVTSLSLNGVPHHCATVTRVEFIACDLLDARRLGEALSGKGFEYVVNCGGYVDHSCFPSGGWRVFSAHFNGVTNLTEVLNQSSLKAFVNIGSSDEYGGNPAPQVESQREAPFSPYSLGKAATSHFLQTLYHDNGFPATTLRLFLVYGPGQNSERFLPQVIRGCLEGKAFPVSKGAQLRDFCHIDDVVGAIFATLNNPLAHGEVINIASGIPMTIRRVVESVRDMVGRGEPLFGDIPYRRGENMALYADVAKAGDILDWHPKTTWEDGLGRTIEYFQTAFGAKWC